MAFGKHADFYSARDVFVSERDAAEQLWAWYRSKEAKDFDNWHDSFIIAANWLDEVESIYYELKKLAMDKGISIRELPQMFCL